MELGLLRTLAGSSGPECPTPRDPDFDQYVLKVADCPKRCPHDWLTCPYAHPGERARRRDPRRHNYTGIACLAMKQEGACALGDACPHAHSAWEYWLHPTRYKTSLCSQGAGCQRKFCFFAHHPSELRTPMMRPGVPAAAAAAAQPALQPASPMKRSGSTPRSITAWNASSSSSIGSLLEGGVLGESAAGVYGGGLGDVSAGAGPGWSASTTPLPLPSVPHTPMALRGLSLPPSPAVPPTPALQPAPGSFWADGTAQALVQAVSGELSAGRMDTVQAAALLGSLLPSEALVQLAVSGMQQQQQQQQVAHTATAGLGFAGAMEQQRLQRQAAAMRNGQAANQLGPGAAGWGATRLGGSQGIW